MNIADFRKQSSTPTLPSSSSVLGLYADNNGVFTSLTSAGVKGQVAGAFSGTFSTGAAQTGSSLLTLQTGVIFGPTGGSRYLLGTPTVFFSAADQNGSLYLIPAYSYKVT